MAQGPGDLSQTPFPVGIGGAYYQYPSGIHPSLRPRVAVPPFGVLNPFQGGLTAPGSLGYSVSTSPAFSPVPTWQGTASPQQYPSTLSPLSSFLGSIDNSSFSGAPLPTATLPPATVPLAALAPATVEASTSNPQPTVSPPPTSPSPPPPSPPPPPPPPPQSEHSDLLSAASSGSVDVVRTLIEDGIDISQTDEEGWNALHKASEKGHVDVVHVLIEKGHAHVNTQNEKDGYMKGSTALHLASWEGHVAVVQLLLEKNADVSIHDANGWTPLMRASFRGHVDVVHVLIEEGHAHVNTQNKNGITALHKACEGGHVPIVASLLHNGADVSISHENGWTPLMAASQEGHVDVVRVLIEEGHAHVNTQNKKDGYNKGRTALHLASWEGHVAVVQLLLEKNADVSIHDANGITALHEACVGGHVPIVASLLHNGADVSISHENGWTPLMAASQEGHVDVVRVLIEEGHAHVNTQNKCGQTALLLACDMGHAPVVELLLHKGADVSITDEDGDTPLMAASSSGDVDVVCVLIEEGHTHVNTQNKRGSTALHSASRMGDKQIVELLLQKGADVSVFDKDGNTPLMTASSCGHVDVVRVLIEEGHAHVDTRNMIGRTALHLACKAEDYETFEEDYLPIVELLLQKGADVSVSDENGWTPLMMASLYGDVTVVRVLIEEGAHVNTQNKHGSTALHMASEKGDTLAVELLLQKGADVSICDEDGDTPLMAARQSGDVDMVRVLTEAHVEQDHWIPMMMALSSLNSKVTSQGAQLKRIENMLAKLISRSDVGEGQAEDKTEDGQAASGGTGTAGDEGDSGGGAEDGDEDLQPPPTKRSKAYLPTGPPADPQMPRLVRRFACKLDRMENMMKSSGAGTASQVEDNAEEFQGLQPSLTKTSKVDPQPGSSEQMPRLMKRVASKLDRMESMMSSREADTASQTENSAEEFMINGTNLLRLPANDPYKLALAAADKLFSKQELASSLLFPSKKSTKPALDQKRVDLLLRLIERKFGKESDKWDLTTLKVKVNQKCRDTKPPKEGSG